MRGLANGASATANWVTNAVVSQLFLALAGYIGASGVFLLLAGIVCAGGLWVYTYLPETKGAVLDALRRMSQLCSLCRLDLVKPWALQFECRAEKRGRVLQSPMVVFFPLGRGCLYSLPASVAKPTT